LEKKEVKGNGREGRRTERGKGRRGRGEGKGRDRTKFREKLTPLISAANGPVGFSTSVQKESIS